MRIFVTGINGQLGHDVMNELLKLQTERLTGRKGRNSRPGEDIMAGHKKT